MAHHWQRHLVSGIFFAHASAGGKAAPITIPSNWGTTGPGASPQTSPTKTLTVPSGNSGTLQFSVSGTGAAGVTYSKNGGAFLTLSDGDLNVFANGDTLAFKLTGGAKSVSIGVGDVDAIATVGISNISTS